jgi:3-oxoadipate enol-lactonase
MPYSNVNEVNIYYEMAGQGPPMVLIHANPFDHNLWMYQIAHFSTWFKVIAVDIRGYGRSDKVTTAYTLTDMCDDVKGVLRTEAVEPAILCGCSVGSGIAILLGLDYPDLFKALILVGGNSGASSRFQKRIDGYTNIGLETYHIHHMKQLVSPKFADSKLGRYLMRTFTESQPRLSGEAIGQVFRAGNSIDTTTRLHTMRVPTLVINGEYDHSLPAGQRTASLVPDALHKILPATGHACCIEDPAGFDALVIDFLDSLGLMPALTT